MKRGNQIRIQVDDLWVQQPRSSDVTGWGQRYLLHRRHHAQSDPEVEDPTKHFQRCKLGVFLIRMHQWAHILTLSR